MTQADAVERVIGNILALYRRWGRSTPVETMRRDWDEFFCNRAAPLPRHEVHAGGVPAEWIGTFEQPTAKAILFLHGGGFRIGSINSHRDLIQRISRAAEARVLAVDYRLCPQHPFPAALDDAIAAYQWMLGAGIAPAHIAFVGDSAGAGLAVAAMLAARARGLPLPGAAVLMSAWTDMEATGQSYETRSTLDPIHQRPMIQALAKGYLAGADARDPLASPIHGDLQGLPPMLLQCGGRETLADDTIVFARKARRAGVQTEVEVFDGMIHVFQMYAAELEVARQAIAKTGAFIQRHVPG